MSYASADSIILDWSNAYASNLLASVDVAHAVVTDHAGNIYVTGESDSSLSVIDIVTVKYGPAGNLLWVKRFTGPQSNVEVPYAIAVDSSGNVYVTGVIYEEETGFDYLTIKYDPNGVEQWAVRYNGPDSDWDIATSIAVDAGGNAYVGGGSFALSGNYDYLTIKYFPDGTEAWVRRYEGIDGLDDGINALTLDDSGNVFVTGVSYTFSQGGDILTVKYDTGGTMQWESVYSGPDGQIDEATDIAIAPDRSAIISGYSRRYTYRDDAITISYDPQGIEQWNAWYASGYLSLSAGVEVDATGGIYVGAWGIGESFTIKYNSSGVEQWAQREDGYLLVDLTLDPSGNPIVTGSTAARIRTIKYQSNGSELWERTYDRDSSINIPTAMTVDDAGSTIVVGSFEPWNRSQDYGVIKYTPNGTQQWVQSYNGSGRSNDDLRSLGVDDVGNVYMAIASGIQNDSALQGYQTVAIVLLKYSPTGDLLWTRQYPQASLRSMVVDGSGNAYVAGSTGDFYVGPASLITLKYTTGGTLEWTQTFSNPNERYEARDIALDGNSNVYVGASRQDGEFLVVKYSSAGNELWARKHDEYDDGTVEVLTAIAVHEDGVVALTGYDGPGGSITVVYESNGDLRWARRAGTTPFAIAIDKSHGVYLAGQHGQLKFSAGGDIAWTNYMVGTIAFDVAVDDDENCYVPTQGLRKYNPTGVLEWNADLPGIFPFEVEVDGCGMVYVAGVDDEDSVVIAKFDPDGAESWRTTLLQPLYWRSPRPYLEVDRRGRVYAAGQTYIGLGGGFRVSFLLKLHQAGVVDLSADSLTLGPVPSHCSREDTVSLLTTLCLTPEALSVAWNDSGFEVTPLGANDSSSLEHQYLVRFTPSSPGLYRDTVLFTETISNQSVALVVEGTGTDLYVHSSSQSLLYDSVEIGCNDVRTLLFTNLACRELSLDLASSSSDFTIQPKTSILSPGDSATILIRFAPLAIGSRSAQLLVTTSEDPVADTITLAGYGTGSGSEIAITDTFGVGWQLISTPVETACPVVLPRSYAYAGGYTRGDSLEIGRGYWNKLLAPVISFAGEPVSFLDHQLDAGWNIIGSLSEPTSVSSLSTTPPGIIQTLFYAYTSTGYLEADLVEPGHGYWVKSSQSGILHLGSGQVPATAPMHPFEGSNNTLLISDSRGNSRTLYLAEESPAQHLVHHELPPPPPDGAFDVRFSSGGDLGLVSPTTTGDLPVQISSASYPVTISWTFHNMPPLRLSIGGSELDMGSTGSTQIMTVESLVMIQVLGRDLVPTAFSLEQNYPNPFNPVTTIRYGLPEAVDVKLEVFTMLGERVSTMVDCLQEPGYYNAEFNGDGHSSGFYVYRLQAGAYTSWRKFLLLK